MAGKREIASLEDYKRELLARSEVHRQNLALHTKELQSSFAWVPRTMGMARSIAPILAVAAPIAGLFFARKKVAEMSAPRKQPQPRSKKGLFATALMGFQLYNRVRPILTAFASQRQAHRRHHNQHDR
jgi:hypothetical protein